MKRKGYIAEGDVTFLLKRYDSSTILSLLYEISKCVSPKLNWDALVKESNTGIKDPREYQALWRHLAYRKELDPDGEELPLEDDDSDLEFDVEPFPSVSADTAAEASNYVKALMGFSSDIAFANSDSGALGLTSIFPGFSNAQAASLECFYRTNQAERKKRKLWTAEEDDELTAGVEKYGEGSWASILKNVFKHDRTASQLAQRWGLIKKRRETGGTATLNNVVPMKPSAPAGIDSEENGLLKKAKIIAEQGVPSKKVATDGCATRKVPVSTSTMGSSDKTTLSLPKQGPSTRIEKTSLVPLKKATPVAIPRTTTSLLNISVASTGPAKAKVVSTMPVMTSTTKPTTPVAATPLVIAASAKASSSTTTTTIRTVPIPAGVRANLLGPDPKVQAAAVAAGARIAPASAAASLLKAAQSKNIVHIRPTTTNSSSPSSSKSSKTNTGTRTPPVIHYIRTGSGAPPPILSSLSGKRPSSKAGKNPTIGKLAVKSNNNNVSRLAIKSSRDGTIQEIMETNKSTTTLKRKIIVARESNGLVRVNSQVSSWYEDMEDTVDSVTVKSPVAVVDVDSDNDEVVAMGGIMGTSSNESFSHSAFNGAITPNGTSPLSHSSGQSD